MNTIPCAKCAHFEQQHKYVGGKKTEVWYGWCKRRSEYPAREWDPARPFDVDVKRLTPDTTVSKPLIVDKAGTRSECSDVTETS